MTPEKIRKFFANIQISINLLCYLAHQIRDCEGGDGSRTQESEDLIIEKFIQLSPNLVIDEVVELCRAFGTYTGCHRVIIAWTTERGVKSKEEGVMLLENILQVENFYGLEARDAVLNAIAKAKIEPEKEPIAKVSNCMCLACQIKRLDADNEAVSILIDELVRFVSFISDKKIVPGSEEYRKAIEDLDISKQAVTILKDSQEMINFSKNERDLIAKAIDNLGQESSKAIIQKRVFVGNVEKLDKMLSDMARKGQLDKILFSWEKKVLTINQLAMQDNLPNGMKDILKKYVT